MLGWRSCKKLDYKLKMLFSNWHDQASDYPVSEGNPDQDSFAELGMAKAMKAHDKIGFLSAPRKRQLLTPIKCGDNRKDNFVVRQGRQAMFRSGKWRMNLFKA